MAYFVSRRFDEALPKLLLAIQDDPSDPPPHLFLAACYAHMGRSTTLGQLSSGCEPLSLS
jgi:hypothetical protein